MEKTIALMALALLCIIAPTTLSAQVGAAEPSRAGLDQVQASFIISDGVSAGLGAGLSEHLRLAVNLDLGRRVKSAGASLLVVYPKQFTVLTGIYGGVGLTYEFSPGAACLHLIGGGEFGKWFAEYEWMIAPRNYGKLRSGLRFGF
ncbi:MAG TPA: hypothetical protein DDZ84_06005 [Firmicutes bacterium]|nr:hypothetical protein [Bacillota bacterium]